MTDNTIRKLRNRRPPPYLMGDSSDPELFGYARSNYPKDFVSPAQQLNSLAKVLSKFINSTNKKFIEKVNDHQSKQASLAKNRTQPIQQEIKKTNRPIEGNKKKQNQKYEMKDNTQKIDRETSKQKDQEAQNVMGNKERIKNMQGTKKETEVNRNIKNGGRIDNSGNGSYMSKIQELKQQQGAALNNLTRIQNDAATKAMQQQQQILKYNNSLRQKIQVPNGSLNKNHSEQKYFKRSTYHIAIAYHIHLINLKQSGRDLKLPLALDPTYPARKLKGEYDSQNPNHHQ